MKANQLERGKGLFKIFTRFLFRYPAFKSQMQIKILFANVTLPNVKRINMSLKITLWIIFNNFLKPIY